MKTNAPTTNSSRTGCRERRRSTGRATAARRAGAALLILLLPSIVIADGGLMPSAPDVIYEPGQMAFIRYDAEQQEERLHILPRFYGDTEEFAWIVPVPAVPEIEISTPAMFWEFRALTQPLHRHRDGAFGCQRSYDVAYPADGNSLEPVGVDIISEEIVGIYQTMVVGADESAALLDSLQTWGFLQPDGNEAFIEILNHYVAQDWYFVTMKVDSTAFANLEPYHDNYYYGYVQPIELRFTTDEIVYPMKISRISAAPESDVVLYVAAAHRVTYPGALTQYANRITPDELAYIRRHFPYAGEQLISGDFLTKLQRYYTPAEMQDDIVLQPAENDNEFRQIYYSGLPVTMGLLMASSLAYGVWRLARSRRRDS